MPNYPQPVVGPMGVVWTPVQQALQAAKLKTANLAAQAQQGATYDGRGNVTTISGTNLNQIVQLGATWNTALNTPVSGFPVGGVPGAHLGTGLANGLSGLAAPTAIATGLITVNSTATATLVSTITGAFVSGMQIGAFTINLATGVTTNAITPGASFTISGTTLTLSQAALTSATAIYAVAATFSQVT